MSLVELNALATCKVLRDLPKGRHEELCRAYNARDQLAFCPEEVRHLGEFDREIKRESNAMESLLMPESTLHRSPETNEGY